VGWSAAADATVRDIALDVVAGSPEDVARLTGAPDAAVAEVLALDAPLGTNAVLAESMDRARAAAYARLAAVGDWSSPRLRTPGDDEVAEVTALGALTGHNVPLVGVLRRRGDATPAVLAAMSSAEWEELVTEAGVAIPSGHD